MPQGRNFSTLFKLSSSSLWHIDYYLFEFDSIKGFSY